MRERAAADISASTRSLLIHTRTAFITVIALVSGLAACSGPALTSTDEPQLTSPTSPTSPGGAGAAAGNAGSSSVAGGPSYGTAGGGGAPAVLPVTAGSGGAAGSAMTSSAGGEAPSAAGATSTPISTPPVTTNPTLPGWKLVWSDDFDAADGAAVDASKWRHDTGGNGWGNQELEYYTDGTENAEQRGGNLVISATRENAAAHSCWYGACQFTSARLLTSGKFSAAYGRVEARIKVPAGKGIWPAFWMLGDNIGDVQWPECGEIDIMEAIGSDPVTLHGSLHGPGYSGGSPLTASTKLPNMAKLSDDFHTYAVEWAPNSVKFYLDSALYQSRTPTDIPSGAHWVYNHPFFMILNLAVGGQWPGSPDQSTQIPARMLVDYVRVYQAN